MSAAITLDRHGRRLTVAPRDVPCGHCHVGVGVPCGAPERRETGHHPDRVVLAGDVGAIVEAADAADRVLRVDTGIVERNRRVAVDAGTTWSAAAVRLPEVRRPADAGEGRGNARWALAHAQAEREAVALARNAYADAFGGLDLEHQLTVTHLTLDVVAEVTVWPTP